MTDYEYIRMRERELVGWLKLIAVAIAVAIAAWFGADSYRKHAIDQRSAAYDAVVQPIVSDIPPLVEAMNRPGGDWIGVARVSPRRSDDDSTWSVGIDVVHRTVDEPNFQYAGSLRMSGGVPPDVVAITFDERSSEVARVAASLQGYAATKIGASEVRIEMVNRVPEYLRREFYSYVAHAVTEIRSDFPDFQVLVPFDGRVLDAGIDGFVAEVEIAGVRRPPNRKTLAVARLTLRVRPSEDRGTQIDIVAGPDEAPVHRLVSAVAEKMDSELPDLAINSVVVDLDALHPMTLPGSSTVERGLPIGGYAKALGPIEGYVYDESEPLRD